MDFTSRHITKVGEAEILIHLPEKGISSVKEEILKGLTADQKYISPKFFYDQTGSELFEEITQLEEYYPTRCEMEILSSIISRLDFQLSDLDIIELGSGDSSKIKTLIRQIPAHLLSTMNYYPVDISRSAIEKSIEDIIGEFEFNSIKGIVTDFLHSFAYMPKRKKRLFCFLGSTIGNLSISEVEEFMRKLGAIMDEGDIFLLGLDIIKDVSIIELAYNDKQGVTAEFNKNILNVVNGHIQSNFDVKDFEHMAFYNRELQRIEMHLRAKQDVCVKIGAFDKRILIKKGESIHTENSYKFSPDRIEQIGNSGGLKIADIFTDSKGWFNLVYYLK